MQNINENNKKFLEFGATKFEVVAVFLIVITLAVIAVICYYSALDKKEADNLLNKANQRAVTISVQIQDGKTLTLNEFKDNGTIFIGAGKINKSQFKLILNGVDPKVCKQMKAMSESVALIQGMNDDCSALYYNIDLKVKNSPVCQAGNYLDNNKCIPCELGDKTCECSGENPYSDGKGGCCHYVANYADTTFLNTLEDLCCPNGFNIAIDNKCMNQNQLL